MALIASNSRVRYSTVVTSFSGVPTRPARDTQKEDCEEIVRGSTLRVRYYAGVINGFEETHTTLKTQKGTERRYKQRQMQYGSTDRRDGS